LGCADAFSPGELASAQDRARLRRKTLSLSCSRSCVEFKGLPARIAAPEAIG
jgi:hypothetical protein